LLRSSAASGLVLATQNHDSSTGGGTRLVPVRIRIGHSADPDDAFMAWGLVSGRVDPQGFDFEFVPEDIQVLNEWALEGRLEVTALSLATYPLVQDRYALLPHGASIGSGYGPIVVAREELSPEALRAVEIAVPGRLTTAFLVLGMALGGPFAHRALAFDRILDEVKSGHAEAGLLIHEGQLTYVDEGLVKVLDLGEWWLLETGLPLPLGVNVARRDVPRLDELSTVLRDSITAGLDHREEAMQYALGFARDLDAKTADRFIEMYVNELTCDYGDEGRQAVTELLRRAEQAGAYDQPVRVEFVGT
jgi:1,4-dihydroxy-6-naphthoate synthase